MFLEVLIDDYISPLLLSDSPVFTGLLRAIGTMALIYLAGICTTFLYNWLMVTVAQGILKDPLGGICCIPFLLRFVYFPIDGAALEQLVMSPHVRDGASIQHHDLVRVLHRVETCPAARSSGSVLPGPC